MKVLGCSATRRRLQAYHDEELSLTEQVSVGAHLEWCEACATTFAEMQLVRVALRAGAPGRAVAESVNDANFQAAVVSRLRAERNASFPVRVRAMFDDMHYVCAGLGALAASAVCVVLTLTVMRYATSARPDSLDAVVRVLASLSDAAAADARHDEPLTSQMPIVIDARMLVPRAVDDAYFAVPGTPAGDGEGSLFMLSAVVTREGRIVNLELHPTGKTPVAGSREAKALEGLRGAVSRARFEPASVAGLPVPGTVNMVWMVSSTTVRGTKVNLAVTPTGKKRRADAALPIVPAPSQV